MGSGESFASVARGWLLIGLAGRNPLQPPTAPKAESLCHLGCAPRSMSLLISGAGSLMSLGLVVARRSDAW